LKDKGCSIVLSALFHITIAPLRSKRAARIAWADLNWCISLVLSVCFSYALLGICKKNRSTLSC
jgi:predicted membrane protein